MKTLLLSIPPNTGRVQEVLVQKLGVTRIIRWMEKNGYSSESYDFLDIDALAPDDNTLKNYLQECKPDVIGISAVVSTSYVLVKKITKIARDVYPNVWIILGGSLSNSANVLIRKTEVDIVIVGDGEVPWLSMLDYIKKYNYGEINHDVLKDIRGVSYITEDDELQFTGYSTPFTQDFDPFADLRITKLGIKNKPELINRFFSDTYGYVPVKDCPWFAIDPRSKDPNRGKRLASINVNKGCTAKCSFCQRSRAGYNIMELNNFEEYLIHLKKEYDVGYIFIVDESFGTLKEHSYEVARILKKQDLLWGMVAVRCKDMTYEDLKFYKENNAVAIKYGFESGSQKMLDIMQKNFKVDDVYRAVRDAVSLGYFCPVAALVGLPGETEDTCIETGEVLGKIACLMGINPTKIGAAIFYAMLFPGTPIYEYAQEVGLVGKTVKKQEEYLKFMDTSYTVKYQYHNLVGAPLSEILFWDFLVYLEASRYFNNNSKNVIDPFQKERNQKEVTFDTISYRELYENSQRFIQKKSHPKIKISTYKKIIYKFRAENIIVKSILGNPLVDRIPRFILYPFIKYWLYFDFIIFRSLYICYQYFKGTLESSPYPIYDKLTQKVKRLDEKMIKDQRAFREVKSLRKIMALNKNKITDKISITEQSQQSLWKGV
jgi:radical SAM superfamily enzyme YgiQ (UPF0313 family)